MSQDEIRALLRKERRAMTVSEIAISIGCNERTVSMQVQQLSNRWREVEIKSAEQGKYLVKIKEAEK